jgi:hypothetical protein
LQSLVAHCIPPFDFGIGSCIRRDGTICHRSQKVHQQNSRKADAQYAVTGTVRLKMPASADVGGSALHTVCSFGWCARDRRKTAHMIAASSAIRRFDRSRAMPASALSSTGAKMSRRRDPAGAEEETLAGLLRHQLSASARACRMTR